MNNKIILEMLSENWSNNSCLGYVILGAKNLDYSYREICELVMAIKNCFNNKTLEEAAQHYMNSPY